MLGELWRRQCREAAAVGYQPGLLACWIRARRATRGSPDSSWDGRDRPRRNVTDIVDKMQRRPLSPRRAWGRILCARGAVAANQAYAWRRLLPSPFLHRCFNCLYEQQRAASTAGREVSSRIDAKTAGPHRRPRAPRDCKCLWVELSFPRRARHARANVGSLGSVECPPFATERRQRQTVERRGAEIRSCCFRRRSNRATAPEPFHQGRTRASPRAPG
jgi:hypothetical protein